MTRIAVLSDVHGNLIALEAVLKEIRKERPDAVLVAGDLVMNGPDPNGTVDALRVLEGEGALIVSGNTDIAVGDFDYGSAFPQYQDGVPETVTVSGPESAIAQVASGSSIGQTDIVTALVAIPGTLVGLAAIYALGVSREEALET